MKRILWVAAVFFVFNVVAYAQSAQPLSSAEIRQNAQQLLTQVRTNHSQFESTQADLNARNRSNTDAATLQRLRNELSRLEGWINREHSSIASSLDTGNLVSSELLDRVQRFIEQHTTALGNLEEFISQSQNR